MRELETNLSLLAPVSRDGTVSLSEIDGGSLSGIHIIHLSGWSRDPVRMGAYSPISGR
jgi:hypothetical protein